MEYFVKISAHDGKCSIETVQTEKADLDFYYQEIDCRCIEIVRMPKLRKKHVFVIDEEGRLKDDAELNFIASIMYGEPLFGTVLMCKEDLRDGEPDIIGFDEHECAAARFALHMSIMATGLFNHRGNDDE